MDFITPMTLPLHYLNSLIQSSYSPTFLLCGSFHKSSAQTTTICWCFGGLFNVVYLHILFITMLLHQKGLQLPLTIFCNVISMYPYWLCPGHGVPQRKEKIIKKNYACPQPLIFNPCEYCRIKMQVSIRFQNKDKNLTSIQQYKIINNHTKVG